MRLENAEYRAAPLLDGVVRLPVHASRAAGD